MRMVRILGFVLFAAAGFAQPQMAFKGLDAHRVHKGTKPPLPAKRRDATRRHLVVQFENAPMESQLEKLRIRGAAILEYVPKNAYVISAPDRMPTEDLDLYWSGAILPEEKLSPAMVAADAIAAVPYYALVEFYSDVDMNDARAISVASNLKIQDNPDLLSRHLLVSGTTEGFKALAQWDEVEYIFPASDDLVSGAPVYVCGGAVTSQGLIGQAVVTVGGWVPAGGSVSLGYAFSSLTAKLPADAAKSEVARALATWSKYVQVTWRESNQTAADQTISVLFASGAHGDAYPFTAPVLAHTFYPNPMNPEPIAGDMHFNDDQNWQIGADVDLFSVALHEAGHALGLGHSDQPGAVMYPYYHRATDLTPEDIAAIQMLYAPTSGTTPPAPAPLNLTVVNPGLTTASPYLNLAGSTSGGTSPVVVTWLGGGGYSGTATGSSNWTITGIPLLTGDNSISVAVTDALALQVQQSVSIRYQPRSVTPSAPSLQIASPAPGATYVSATSSVTLTGTASDTSGISLVTWTNSAGAGGTASGTTNWSTGPISLANGATQISITAHAGSGQTSTQSLQVSYTAPPVTPPATPPATPPSQPGTSDSTAPTLTILTPSLTTLSTSGSTIAFAGTASDDTGVTMVTWSTSNGDSGTAGGTTNWSVPAIPLLIGTNTVVFHASDAAGNVAWRSAVVTRY